MSEFPREVYDTAYSQVGTTTVDLDGLRAELAETKAMNLRLESCLHEAIKLLEALLKEPKS
jgi:hypothetical protein